MKRYVTVIISLLCIFSIAAAGCLAYFKFVGTQTFTATVPSSIAYAFGSIGTEGSQLGLTSNTPFLIQTSDHLKNLEILNNRGDLGQKYYFKLAPTGGELDMNGAVLSPIGNEQYPFLGDFHGNTSLISNLTIESKSGDHDIGFFGYIGSSSVVHDIILNKITVKSHNNSPTGLHTAAKTTDPEDCHIGVFCGHLDGNIYAISIKDAVLDINSPGIDYYSKYGSLGYAALTAKINDILVPDLPSGSTAGDNEYGYWYTDYYQKNIGGTVQYVDANGQTQTVNNFLTGGFAQKSGNDISFRGASALPSVGIFSYHPGGSTRNKYNDKMQDLGSEISLIDFYRNATPTTALPVNLNSSYTEGSDEYRFQQDIWDPYSASLITKFRYGVAINDNITGAGCTVVNEYTGADIVPETLSKVTGGIYFKVTKVTAARPAKIICIVKAFSAGQHIDLFLANSSPFKPIVGSFTTTYNIPNNGKLIACEFIVDTPGEYAIGSYSSKTCPYIAYLAVGGQDRGQGDHVNTQNYQLLPTIDFIYDTAVPVTVPTYNYSKILPYFILGSKSGSNPIDSLKVEFLRTLSGGEYSFVMNASGADANGNDSLSHPLFDYINKLSEDTVTVNRSG